MTGTRCPLRRGPPLLQHGNYLGQRSDPDASPRRRLPSFAVDPDASEAGRAGARDVAVEAVADHDGFVDADVQEIQGPAEDGRVGLADADVAGHDDGVELGFEAR